jgi:hypothetical protein
MLKQPPTKKENEGLLLAPTKRPHNIIETSYESLVVTTITVRHVLSQIDNLLQKKKDPSNVST